MAFTQVPETINAPTPPIPSRAIVAPPHLSKYQVPRSTFLASHPQYQVLAVSACIVHPTTEQPHLLIVRRATTERGFPNCWEAPGGGVDAEDASLLDALVREVKEETGLDVTEIVGEVEPAIEFTTGKGKWMKHWLKLSFVVKVDAQNTSADGFPIVRLNPEEHQEFSWVVRQEVELCEKQLPGGVLPTKKGDGSHLTMVSVEQQQVMLQALSFGSS